MTEISWLLVYAAAGLAAGGFSGLLGIGGGVVIVPVLVFSFLAQGFPAEVLVHTAVGSSLAAIACSMLSSAWSHHRRGSVDFSLFLKLIPGLLAGVCLGGLLAGQLPGNLLLLLFALLLSFLGLRMLLQWHPPARRVSALPGRGPMLLAGGAIGTVSAMCGIGGGAFTVSFLDWCGVHIRRAVGTAAACGVPIALGGAIAFTFTGWGNPALPAASTGFVYWPAVLPAALCSVLAAPVGVYLAHRLYSPLLRRVFGAVIFTVGWVELFFSLQQSNPFFYRGIDPVMLHLGPVAIHWYGVMYMLAFLLCWRLLLARSRRPDSPLQPGQAADLVLYGALGAILGGRLGYVIFYGFERLAAEPLWLFAIGEGGMSFHGGLLGTIFAAWLYSRRQRLDTGRVLDLIAPAVPLGLGLGRLGNFINQELWGRPTDMSWGIIFAADPSRQVRHPSQLYELLLEGVLLYLLLTVYAARPRQTWAVGGCFLLAYGLMRFAVEFLREPDAHIGFQVFGWLTRGQLLCLPMVLVGMFLMWRPQRRFRAAE